MSIDGADLDGQATGDPKAVPTPRPALLPLPDEVPTAAEAAGRDSFLLRGGLIDAWFQQRSDVLLVTFDNLASVGEYDPPQPWLQARAAQSGLSILGIMASRKDWYRNPDTPALLTRLREAGFFDRFRRIVFAGSSMGGYAALTYSALVPESVVLAFSPQTTLSNKIARFEHRFRYAQRKWDWSSPAFLDAAAAAASAAEVYVVFDPFVPEDRAHARRIRGAHVRDIRLDHLGHKAIRHLKTLGLLQPLIEQVAAGRFDAAAFWRGLRARRGLAIWQRNLLAETERRGHARLGRDAARMIVTVAPGRRFVRRLAEPVAAPPSSEADSVITVDTPRAVAPFTGQILRLSQALVLPERGSDKPLASGVLHADGRWCEPSRTWIRARKATEVPTLSPDEPVADLPGTHLFAGHFRGHFGHFLVESTARLWALGHIREPMASILYLPYRGAGAPVERVIEWQAAFFRLLGIESPVRTYGTALRVERLIVPELGFGWLDRYAGSPAYRAFMQGRLNAAVAAEGAEKLYISRARLNAQHGGILGETVIEENLARAGYEIFHPEKHPLEVQIARYKAARQIVALDGSALHLAAYVLRPGSRVAMILRRSKTNAADYRLQFRSFCSVDPEVIDVIRRDWVDEGAKRVHFRSVGEIDFVALFDRLKALSFVPAEFRPDLPGSTELEAMLAAFEGKRGLSFRALGAHEANPGEDDA